MQQFVLKSIMIFEKCTNQKIKRMDQLIENTLLKVFDRENVNFAYF